MIDTTLEMEQYDCPFIDTTADHGVAFSAVQWEFDTATASLETRMVVEGDEPEALADGLVALRDHDQMAEYDLIRKTDGVAQIRTVIDETDAMQTIRDNNGYITGPFYIDDGTGQILVEADEEAPYDQTEPRSV